jgi:Cyclin D1 binding domain
MFTRKLSMATLSLFLVLNVCEAFVSIKPLARWGYREFSLHESSSSSSRESQVRHQLEFQDLEPLEESAARRLRVERDLRNQQQFVAFGDALWDLRAEMDALTRQLASTHMRHHAKRAVRQEASALRTRLASLQQRDPEMVYARSVQLLTMAHREGRFDEAERYATAAANARSCLPQFNLDGLWVGKYGPRYELINITYVGDTLIAEKVTGMGNVPRGEISFQVDLCPLRQAFKPQRHSPFSTSSTGTPSTTASIASTNDRLDSGASSWLSPLSGLEPILLTEKAAKKWGTRQLPRYSGLGQVAEAGYTNRQWLAGQLIIISGATAAATTSNTDSPDNRAAAATPSGEYFSFAWLPIEQQIFFGRPSPELALQMLRDGSSLNQQPYDSHGTAAATTMSPMPNDSFYSSVGGIGGGSAASTTTSSSSSSSSLPLEANMALQKAFATRCLELSHEHEDEMEGNNGFGGIWYSGNDDEEECYLQ